MKGESSQGSTASWKPSGETVRAGVAARRRQAGSWGRELPGEALGTCPQQEHGLGAGHSWAGNKSRQNGRSFEENEQ